VYLVQCPIQHILISDVYRNYRQVKKCGVIWFVQFYCVIHCVFIIFWPIWFLLCTLDLLFQLARNRIVGLGIICEGRWKGEGMWHGYIMSNVFWRFHTCALCVNICAVIFWKRIAKVCIDWVTCRPFRFMSWKFMKTCMVRN